MFSQEHCLWMILLNQIMDSCVVFLKHVHVLNMKEVVDILSNGTFNCAAKRSQQQMEDIMWNLHGEQKEFLLQEACAKDSSREDTWKKRQM